MMSFCSCCFLRGYLPLSKDLAPPALYLAAREHVIIDHVHKQPFLLSTCCIHRLVRPLQPPGHRCYSAYGPIIFSLKPVACVSLSTFARILSTKGLLTLRHLFILLAIPLCLAVQFSSHPFQLPQALLGVLLQGANCAARLRHGVNICVL